jgi:hypothetical protein
MASFDTLCTLLKVRLVGELFAVRQCREQPLAG